MSVFSQFIRGPRLLLIALLGALLATWALAQPSPAPAVNLGWSEGQVAAGTAIALTPMEPVSIEVPAALAERITGPSALFYFSPTCPHCIEAMKEVGPLAEEGTLHWIGISTGSASEFEIEQFMQDHGQPFELWHDAEHGFANAVGARGTPNIYLVEPLTEDSPLPETSTEGMRPILVTEAYLPYSRGMAALLRLRTNLDNPFAQMQGYQGDLLCSRCHVEEARSWAISHHSIAYRTLYLRDKALDPECVSCHVTGMGEPGGFELGDHGSPMSGVGCESCHGPAGPHDGVADDALARCEGCHDAEHSVQFDTARAVPHIDHFRASSMSDEELNQALISLIDGEAERPLLAFPDGPTVGAKACRSCHKPQHKWLTKDPHSSAIDTLGEDASRSECVRCHATATQYDSSMASMGAAEKSIEDYRVDEGVGCEACHGPGQAHMASPSKSNIVGLGESCPECIIEGICTSCHTPKWDMKWDLDTRLGAIAH
jgi:hypothetical protein